MKNIVIRKIKKLILGIFIFSISFSPKLVYAQQIKEIKINGATILSEEIESLLTPYRGQNFKLREIKELTARITQLYKSKGHITSGAFFPDQEISEGVIIIQVIEGELEDIEIDGLKRLKDSYINSRFKEVHRGVFDINKLTKALESLQVDPLIGNVQAELAAGTSSSSSILLLEIEESPLIQGSLTINNRASPTVGEVKGIVALSHQNFVGIRDRAFVQYDITEGVSIYEIGYTVPLNYSGTSFSVTYRGGDINIIQEPFDQVDIFSEPETISVKLTQEIAQSLTTTSSISLIFEKVASDIFLGGRPFPFADGSQDGRSRLSVFRLEGILIKRSDNSILSVRSRLSFGADLFDATINENDPDARFLTWLGQFQLARALDDERKIILITRLASQVSTDSLLPLEKFSVGGATTVRGYIQNGFVGDNGVVGTLEIAFTVVDNEDWGNLRLSPFADLGRVWNTDGDFGQTLASVGLGIDWQVTDFLLIELDYGVPLIAVKDRGNSISGDGISFSLRWNLN